MEFAPQTQLSLRRTGNVLWRSRKSSRTVPGKWIISSRWRHATNPLGDQPPSGNPQEHSINSLIFVHISRHDKIKRIIITHQWQSFIFVDAHHFDRNYIEICTEHTALYIRLAYAGRILMLFVTAAVAELWVKGCGLNVRGRGSHLINRMAQRRVLMGLPGGLKCGQHIVK